MQDLIIEIQELRKELNTAIEVLKQIGQKKADKERNYRVALAKKILLLRDEKIPVTIINDLARGDEEIAKLKFERDVAETLYETALQKIYAIKIELGIVQNQIEAERKGE